MCNATSIVLSYRLHSYVYYMLVFINCYMQELMTILVDWQHKLHTNIGIIIQQYNQAALTVSSISTHKSLLQEQTVII